MRFDSVKVILFMLVILFVLSGAASASEQSAGGAAAVRADLTKLPLSFIPNQGQADPAVLFQVKAEGHTIFLTKENVVLVTDNDGTPVVFSTTVAGANPAVTVVGVDPLPGTASFFVGNDQADWYTGLPTYGGVEYQNVLPGVDLTYRGTNGVLKREFVVAPGADASGIVIVYDAVDGLAYGPDGTLEVQTPAGVLTETAPVCYQVINGKTIDVPAQYNIIGDGRVGFNIGAYDKAYPLVIDPALIYSSYLGGSVNDAAMGIVVDSLGQAYVTGYTESNNFPVNYSFTFTNPNGTYKGNVRNGCSDVFVTKVSANGKDLLYSSYLGGNSCDVGNGIAVDTDGKAYVTGYTTSQNFPVDTVTGTPKNANSPPTLCPFPGCLGQADAFLTVLSPNGLSISSSTCFGGNNSDIGTSVAVMGTGRVYLTGFTCSDNFPMSTAFPPIQNQLNQGVVSGASDAFIISYVPGGTTNPPEYSTYWGGSANDEGLGIAANNTTGSYYVTGWTESDNLTTTPGSYPYSDEKDAFVSKFTFPSTLDYSTYLGGEENDEGRGIAVANISGGEYAYVTGVTNSNTFPTTATALRESPNFGTSAYGDAFISQLDPLGQLKWSTYLGGLDSDGGNAIALDSLHSVYITGYTTSSNFPVLNPIAGFGTKRPFQDAFITMVNPNLTTMNFSTFLGGNLDEAGTGIAVSDPQNIFVSGYTTSLDFPTNLANPTVNSYKVLFGAKNGKYYGGWVDGFVTHINNLPTPAQPVANFTYTLLPVTCGLPTCVQFQDMSTGAPEHYLWNFGDGGTSPDPSPLHCFAGGSYNVSLTVTNTFGTNSTTKLVVIPLSAGPKFTLANGTTAIGEIYIPENGSQKVSLYLNATPCGLAGYNMTVSFRNTIPPIPYVPNTINANITNVSRPEWMDANIVFFQVSNILFPLGDGYNVTFQGVDTPVLPLQPNGKIVPGAVNVRLANITIHGNVRGNSTLHINSTQMITSDTCGAITLCPPDANLTVYVVRLQVIPWSIKHSTYPSIPKIPQDLNGDGLYEDVNGDGIYSNEDFVDFASNLYWITNLWQPIWDDTNEYQPFFDFDQNGVLNFQDAITLWINVPWTI